MEISKLTHIITVRDIYGTDSPKAPEGYEFTGEFRDTRRGDTILTVPTASCGGLKASQDDYTPDGNVRYPVLILRRVKEYSDTELLDYLLDEMRSTIAGSKFINSILGKVRPRSESTKHLREMFVNHLKMKEIQKETK